MNSRRKVVASHQQFDPPGRTPGLDQSRIKDLRTGVEVGNTTAVLDGDLDQFMEASLKAGL